MRSFPWYIGWLEAGDDFKVVRWALGGRWEKWKICAAAGSCLEMWIPASDLGSNLVWPPPRMIKLLEVETYGKRKWSLD